MAAYSGSYRPGPDTQRSRPPAADEASYRQSPKREEAPAFSLQGILKKIEAVGMESDDLLLALVLFLMYRESGDKDLLILLAAMLLC